MRAAACGTLKAAVTQAPLPRPERCFAALDASRWGRFRNAEIYVDLCVSTSKRCATRGISAKEDSFRSLEARRSIWLHPVAFGISSTIGVLAFRNGRHEGSSQFLPILFRHVEVGDGQETVLRTCLHLCETHFDFPATPWPDPRSET